MFSMIIMIFASMNISRNNSKQKHSFSRYHGGLNDGAVSGTQLRLHVPQTKAPEKSMESLYCLK